MNISHAEQIELLCSATISRLVKQYESLEESRLFEMTKKTLANRTIGGKSFVVTTSMMKNAIKDLTTRKIIRVSGNTVYAVTKAKKTSKT